MNESTHKDNEILEGAATFLKVSAKAKEIKEEVYEKVVCNENDLDDNEMNDIDFGNGTKVLLIKQNKRFYATVADCGHFHHATPLIHGTLGEKKIRCPQHGECINIETGEIENFPGLDKVQIHEVHVDKGKVKITVKKPKPNISREMTKYSPDNQQKIVIVGGGPAAQTCAETLRQNDFTGKITMICKESCLPYNRTWLSKSMNITTEDVQLRPQSFFTDNSIDIVLNDEVTEVYSSNKKLMLSSGQEMSYDKLFIATGSRARQPKIPGITLRNIFTLRTFDDAMNINVKLRPECHLVVYGAGLLGMELAAQCVEKVGKVTVIDRNPFPLMDTFGKLISERIRELYRTKGINFIMETEIRSFVSINQEEHLSAMKLSNGDFIKADVCVIAVGVKLNTEFFRSSEISLNPNGSIDTDSYLETSIRDIYAGGDIANVPIGMKNLTRENIQNYGVAQYHGRIAALNMIGKTNKALTIPFIHTTFFGHHLTYVGYKRATKICINGTLKDLKFSAFFLDNHNTVVGVCATQPNKITSDYAEKITQGHEILKQDLHQHFGERTKVFFLHFLLIQGKGSRIFSLLGRCGWK